MKSPHLVFSLALLLLLPATTSGLPAQTLNPPAGIVVSGSAEVKVVPDLIDIRLGVEVTDPSMETAHGLNELKVASVLKTLRNLGIAEKDIQTDFVGIQPIQDPRNEYGEKPDRYRVQRTVSCTLREVKQLDRILCEVIAQGVTQVHGLEFRTSELRKFRDQARVEAVKAAREKAFLLAGELGVKAGRPLQISETSEGGSWTWNGGWSGRGFNNLSDAPVGPADGAPAVGQITISATVNVIFSME